jgi:hypothetical protein
MKKILLIAIVAGAAPVFAGPESKEIMQQAPPPCEWYRAHEWDLDLWGTFAFSVNTGSTDRSHEEPANEPIGFVAPAFIVSLGSDRDDRFLDRDSTWGGGADLKYFFSKYWALGVEGLVLDCQRNIGGGALGTFTFRYPIGCSRFAPYGWVGGGVMAGGSHSDWFFNLVPITRGSPRGPIRVDKEFNDVKGIENKHAEATAQFGTGLEYRITPRIGIMGDFAWNILSGPQNNFGMARGGITLSY